MSKSGSLIKDKGEKILRDADGKRLQCDKCRSKALTLTSDNRAKCVSCGNKMDK